ncbi:hypothetical protein CY35_01G171400 [Sphagnum magellanicum]|nr:hypothetical protein CY35_01G171400 [Sphagnum magellanicum]
MWGQTTMCELIQEQTLVGWMPFSPSKCFEIAMKLLGRYGEQQAFDLYGVNNEHHQWRQQGSLSQGKRCNKWV